MDGSSKLFNFVTKLPYVADVTEKSQTQHIFNYLCRVNNQKWRKLVPLFYAAFHNRLMQYAHISAMHALLDFSETCAAICPMYTLQVQQFSGQNYLRKILQS